MNKEQTEVLIQEEIRRSLRSVFNTHTDMEGYYRWTPKHEKTWGRMMDTVKKYQPSWKRVVVSNKVMTICTLKGSNGGVVSTGIAWKAPKEVDNEDTGKAISFSRAVRYLVAKRLGITS